MLNKISTYSLIWLMAISSLATLERPGFAQENYENINLARIQREVNLMETILGDMLSGGSEVSQSLRGSRIRGIYVPDVGVVFRISASPYFTGFRYIIDARSGGRGENNVDAIVVGPGGVVRSTSVDAHRAMLDSTIFDFLEYYADASGQLDEKEQIIIVYEPEQLLTVFNVQGQRQAISSPKGFTLTARKSDILKLRTRQLNRKNFQKNVSRSDEQDRGRYNNQVRTFANVCRRTLDTSEGAGYRMYGEMSHLFIDDFGVIFMIDVVQAMNDPYNIMARMQDEMNRNRMFVKKLQEITRQNPDDREVREALAKLRSETDSTKYSKRKQAYNQFERRVANLLLDYSRSLRMLEPEHKLTLAVKIRDNATVIPERVVFQIKKDDLDAYHTKKITRDTVSTRITIKRYGVKAASTSW